MLSAGTEKDLDLTRKGRRMNKQDILKFLKNKEDEAITKIKAKCSKELDQLQEDVIKDMNINFEDIDELAEYMLDHLQPIVEKIQSQPLWQNHSRVSNFVKVVQVLKDHGIKDMIQKDIYTTPRTNLKCIREMQNSLDLVVNEHKKVVGNIEDMRGPEATKYLTELGFKLPQSRYKKTEQLEHIDKSKLFIGG